MGALGSPEEIRQDLWLLPRLSSAARLMSLGQFKNTRGANYHTTPNLRVKSGTWLASEPISKFARPRSQKSTRMSLNFPKGSFWVDWGPRYDLPLHKVSRQAASQSNRCTNEKASACGGVSTEPMAFRKTDLR